MLGSRALGVGVIGLVLSTHALQGQAGAHYRDFQLGGTLPSVTELTGALSSQAKTVHQRPALMQELEWRPSYFATGSAEPQHDPVQQIVFSFYNDQLFRMVVDYDPQRTQGMTKADMIEALSAVYGPTSTPTVKKSGTLAPQLEEESGTSAARWGDTEYSVVLYRAPYGAGFRLIVTSSRLDALARTAAAQAIRLEARDAPGREIARQKKEADDTRASQEKARLANKAAFRP
jgi:hypothetical protein